MKIYIDENISPNLAKGLNILEKPFGAGIEVLSIKEVFGEGVQDEDWIPKVGLEKGIVITQDYNIHRTRLQKELYLESGLGIFFFSKSKTGFSYWEITVELIKRWDRLKKLATKTQLPFAYRCTSRSNDFEQIV